MSSSNLKQTLASLGLRQTDLARLVDVSPRTVSQWATGAHSVPAAVSGYLRLLELAQADVREAELDRLPGRGRALDDGLYRITYRSGADDDDAFALAVLRDGKILGADRYGGVFKGAYAFDRTRGANIVKLSFTLPPYGTLAGGYTAGPNAEVVDATCVLPGPAAPGPRHGAHVLKSTLTFARATLEVELFYVGLLPN